METRSLFDRVTWPLVVLVAVVGGVVLGVFAMLDDATRADVLDRVGSVAAPHVATILAALAAGVAATAARRSHAETKAQTPLIQTAVRQTNGELTQRVRDAVRAELDERTAVLDVYEPSHADGYDVDELDEATDEAPAGELVEAGAGVVPTGRVVLPVIGRS